MKWQLVSLDAVSPQPWRNGGGTTRELLAWPAPDHWAVRISVADVTAAGPFSKFEGIERWFSVLQGAGVVLTAAGGKHWLRPENDPFRFDGGLPVDCALIDGPTRDFNLMAPPGRSRLRRLQDRDQMFKTRGPGIVGLYAHRRPARIVIDWVIFEVPAYHLAWCHRAEATGGIARGEDALLLEAKE